LGIVGSVRIQLIRAGEVGTPRPGRAFAILLEIPGRADRVRAGQRRVVG
jgi:hypothetical protein